jgi:hypothetical protein
MTTEEYIAKQRKAFTQIIEKDIPLQRAVRDTMAKQVTRIFVEGKNSADSNIGQYDTKRALYVNPNKAPRKGGEKVKGIEGLLPTQGKTGKQKFADGRPHKTTFVNNYKDLRNRIGRRTDKVDLFYSGDLKSDISNAKTGVKPTQVNVHEYVTGLHRPENVKKANGLDEKYGSVLPHTTSEKQNFFYIANKEFQLILLNA